MSIANSLPMSHVEDNRCLGDLTTTQMRTIIIFCLRTVGYDGDHFFARDNFPNGEKLKQSIWLAFSQQYWGRLSVYLEVADVRMSQGSTA